MSTGEAAGADRSLDEPAELCRERAPGARLAQGRPDLVEDLVLADHRRVEAGREAEEVPDGTRAVEDDEVRPAPDQPFELGHGADPVPLDALAGRDEETIRAVRAGRGNALELTEQCRPVVGVETARPRGHEPRPGDRA